MSEKEKDIVQAIIEGLPKMTDFEKGYFLGVVESKNHGSASEKRMEKGEGAENQPGNGSLYVPMGECV